jgi:hypothetical protein
MNTDIDLGIDDDWINEFNNEERKYQYFYKIL